MPEVKIKKRALDLTPKEVDEYCKRHLRQCSRCPLHSEYPIPRGYYICEIIKILNKEVNITIKVDEERVK